MNVYSHLSSVSCQPTGRSFFVKNSCECKVPGRVTNCAAERAIESLRRAIGAISRSAAVSAANGGACGGEVLVMVAPHRNSRAAS